jgi:Kef-type K+ transport system membrane component KefB
VGSALIIGAFAAGIILSGTNQFGTIEARMKPVADIFTPIFFLSIGAAVDVRVFTDPKVLGIGGALFAIAVVGKLAAGWAAPWRSYNRLAVGIGMAPRGEVGLIFARIGLTAGVLSQQLFSAILLMVIGTTFMAPPLLKWAFTRFGRTDEAGETTPVAAPPQPG